MIVDDVMKYITIKLNKEDTYNLHRVQLCLLLEFDKICRQNNIRYIISGGTLLGAVRHHGFIPWDDDVDVRMDRNEYDKFCKVCNDYLDKEKFFFQTYETDPAYPWFYGKLRYKASRYTRCGQEHIPMQDGIFLDIMPGDGVPNAIIGKKIVSYIVYGLKKCLYATVGKKTESTLIKKTWYCMLAGIPRRLVFGALNSFAQRYKADRYSSLTCYSFTAPGQVEYTDRSWHTDVVEVLFEGHKFFAPKEYDKWLRMTYGDDYMTPPPKEQQKMHLDISDFYIEGYSDDERIDR